MAQAINNQYIKILNQTFIGMTSVHWMKNRKEDDWLVPLRAIEKLVVRGKNVRQKDVRGKNVRGKDVRQKDVRQGTIVERVKRV
jgi:hypothetical protein